MFEIGECVYLEKGRVYYLYYGLLVVLSGKIMVKMNWDLKDCCLFIVRMI